MDRYNCILYCKERLISHIWLFLIVLILCSYNLALGETADTESFDSNPVCSGKLIPVLPLKGRNVMIDASEAILREEYYSQNQMENLHWKLEYLSIAMNGLGRINLVLKTFDGQLDLLESSFTTTVIEKPLDGQAATSSRELKYSFFDIFAGKLQLKNIEFSYHTTLRRIRLVIMEAFPRTFVDFINNQAVESSNNEDYSSIGIGLADPFHRCQVLTGIVEDLNAMTDAEIPVIQTPTIQADDETLQAISTIREHLRPANAVNKDDLKNFERDIVARLKGISYDFDSFRRSLFRGPLAQAIDQFYEDYTIDLRIERRYLSY